ncbi:uncharacterized protein cubi_03103 [Cryptosporidium ubiquitum]|uniref:Uncharacterized protein n=1 Tax=Cryptosporidium ubiquitum TaxID=857276 RepID=A0A1J4ML73_9CRYT|nr:uncharacterized protein cubi_03103 [Cryptosporidium ubiquitum]OII74993.1 hypothetical protein cubi_03103 [Cryptosporidium ubiquitum]
MIEVRRTSQIPLWASKILVLVLFLVVFSDIFETQNKLLHFQKISLLKLQEGSIKDETNKSTGSEALDLNKKSDFLEVDNRLEENEVNSEAKLETSDVNEIESKVSEYSLDSVDELISPIVSICLTELTNIHDILELEYNSISSISMLDNLEECINTKNTIDKILKIMIKAKELLFYEKKGNFSDNNSLKENSGKESKNNKNKTSDLFFYLQTNISILKKTISLYNIKYRVFSSQEQILSRITMLMNEINTLVSKFKNLTKNNKNTFEKVMFEVTKPVSKVIHEYKSILRKTRLFMFTKYHTKHSKNIEHYIQTISCMLKYRIQSSPAFDELLFMLKPTLKSCR